MILMAWGLLWSEQKRRRRRRGGGGRRRRRRIKRGDKMKESRKLTYTAFPYIY
jgi:hypothetical protein